MAAHDDPELAATHREEYAIFTIDRIMRQGSWLDYGMFLQNAMIAARARGLDMCPQAAFTRYHRIVADCLRLPPERMLVCGMDTRLRGPRCTGESTGQRA